MQNKSILRKMKRIYMSQYRLNVKPSKEICKSYISYAYQVSSNASKLFSNMSIAKVCMSSLRRQ